MDSVYAKRPITDDECRLARASLGPGPITPVRDLYIVALFQSLVIVGVAGAIGYLISNELSLLRANLWLILIVVFLGAFVMSYGRNAAVDQVRREQQRRLEQELAGGAVEEARFRATAAVLIQRDPPSYCYRLEDDQGLLLRSYPEGRHPNSEFVVVRLPQSRLILRCPTFGVEVPVIAELPSDTDTLTRPEAEPFPVDWEACKRGDFTFEETASQERQHPE